MEKQKKYNNAAVDFLYNNSRIIIPILAVILIIVNIFSIYQEFETQGYAKQCGFDDGVLHCVCTEDAYNQYLTIQEQEQLNDLGNISLG